MNTDEWAGTSFLVEPWSMVELAIPQGLLRLSPYENSDGDCKTMLQTLLMVKIIYRNCRLINKH